MSGQSLAEVILDELRTDGAPLEMRVAARFLRTAHVIPASPTDLIQGHAFGAVRQGVHYWDEAGGCNRETDVVAVTWNGDRTASVTFVAECKHRDGGGLVVFYGSQGSDMDRGTSYASTLTATDWIAARGSAGIGDGRLAPGVPGPAGYALRFAPGGKQKDHAYAAIQQVTSAAHALVPDRPSEWHVVIPVIVTDVPLFRCELSSDGEPQLTAADRGRVRWPDPTQRGKVLAVHVVSEHALDSFLLDAGAAAHDMLEMFSAT